MKIKSSYRKEFSLDENDVIMWNEHIYQLLSQREDDGTYPVLNENKVRQYINNGELKFVKHYVTEFTRVPVTYYQVS